ncbi:S-adenosyl-L-methionine-dependent methyltransferase [Aspergillus piperis CBS 112811]|uniref:S-adenosyl-L-methionine-dependent methyltransferase n=1 Tax=Aspergillus piperis CBS 112811 TaxID=1448313 RepID=A0A8G1QQQ4_9EURO|nr:S-adenosyl-L-methionine-dependent methyltransferase [Aspergillus piperis CBS 112811]RAH51864.1 S-adenosyl-L-methionine-dependent methyltransferase [Aspergillus piperis CBS 112811]
MTTSAAEEYALDRSWLDNVRINAMHQLVGQVYQGHIHPRICTANPEMRIADVGTGTAIWLTDLASKLPESVRLDGLDVSFDAAPLREWLPPNVTLHYWDVKSPVPEHLVGAYDLVNVRFFTIVLRNSEIKDALNNLSRLLKPGGYLQWTDADMSSIRPVKIRPDISDEPLKRFETVLRGNDERFYTSWVPDLGTRFQEAKFVDVDVDRRDPPHYIAQSLFETVMVALEVFTRNKDMNEQKVQELRTTIRDAAKASREGSYLQYTYYRVIGRKATGTEL